MYNKYIVLSKIYSGNKSPFIASNRNILPPNMLELYDSILEDENINLDEEQVFKIVLDFFKTSKEELLIKYKENLVSNISSSFFDNNFISKQLDNLYNQEV